MESFTQKWWKESSPHSVKLWIDDRYMYIYINFIQNVFDVLCNSDHKAG